MARKRTPKGPSRIIGSLPTAAELLGLVVGRLGLPDAPDADALRDRNHQRFLSGETKPRRIADRVIASLASVLANHGYIETTGWSNELGFPSPSLLLNWAIRDLRARWDQACVRVRGGTLRGATLRPVVRTAAHLVVIDLALRGGAWLVLKSTAEPPSGLPPCIPTTEVVLKAAIRQTKRTAPQLAEALGIDRTAIDAWQQGARPSDANLGVLSRLLANEPGAILACWKVLRRNIAVAELMKRLRTTPWFADEVDDLWRTFWVIARRVAALLRSQDDQLDANDWPRLLTGLVTWGSAYPISIPLLNDLRTELPHAWQSDLVAGPGWRPRLDFAAGLALQIPQVHLPPDLPEPLRALGSDPAFRESVVMHMLGAPTRELSPRAVGDDLQTILIKNPPDIAAENRRVQARVAASLGVFDEAIEHLERAIELVPTHADAHFELGAALWQAGDLERGLAECRIAVSLRPGWELAQVEIGIILIVAERYEEARVHLEALYTGSPTPTTHLKFNLGSARWRCDAFRDALVLLEEVLADPSYASYPYALDQAAHCAFKLGDDKRGRAWAKQAHDLGCDTTYADWVRGAYRKSGR